MSDRIFTPAQKRPIRDYMTISRPAGLGPAVPVTWFSMGGGTSITPEAYDVPVLYLGGEGSCRFLLQGTAFPCTPGSFCMYPHGRSAAPKPTQAPCTPKSLQQRSLP